MNKISKKGKIGILILALACSGVASADQIQINGSIYACQNTCVINWANNSMSISDSLGGWWNYVGPAKVKIPPAPPVTK